MNPEDWKEPTERINAGEPIPPVSAVLVEHWWAAVSHIPADRRNNVAIGDGAFAGLDPDQLPQSPGQRIALMTRVAILQALVERGVLDAYMKDDSSKKAVFAAVANMPCDKNDLGEALAEKILRDMPPDRRQDAIEEFKRSGYDPSQLRVLDKLIKSMQVDRS